MPRRQPGDGGASDGLLDRTHPRRGHPVDGWHSLVVDGDWAGIERRIAGGDRYETAAAVSAASYSPGLGRAHLATGSDFPDALAGVPVAAAETPAPGPPPAAVAQESHPLAAARRVVLGGSAVVSDQAAQLLPCQPAHVLTSAVGISRHQEEPADP